MPQETDSEPQAHFLCSAKHQVTASAGQDRFALIAEEYQANGKHEQPNLLLRQNAINQPLENQRSEHRQETAQDHAQETDDVHVNERADLP